MNGGGGEEGGRGKQTNGRRGQSVGLVLLDVGGRVAGRRCPATDGRTSRQRSGGGIRRRLLLIDGLTCPASVLSFPAAAQRTDAVH